MDTDLSPPEINTCVRHGQRPNLVSVRKSEREKGEHKPTHSIRMEDDLWDAIGDEYGNRSAAIEQAMSWLLRIPGAKQPPRKAP
jgi:hypothetical protein